MSEAKHTPGPWSRAWIYSGIRHLNKNVDDSCFLDDTEQDAIHSGEFNYPNVRNNEGDADLIAAAPDMLEALELARECLADCASEETLAFERGARGTQLDQAKRVKEIHAKMDAALAKAKGGRS